MSRIAGIRRLFRLDRGPRALARDVDEELRFHFDSTVEALVRGGLAPDEARREAEHRFGDPRAYRAQLVTIDRSRLAGERRADWWEGIAMDARYALRALRRAPGFTLAVILTFALGIGANAAMFGIVDRLLFRPPALMRDVDRVHRVYLARTIDGKEFAGSHMPYARFRDLARDTRSFDHVAAVFRGSPPVGDAGEARSMSVGAVSGTFWDFFSARPALGRFFGPSEDLPPSGAPVAVLSWGYWQAQYAGQPSVLGRTIHIGPVTYTIIGVAPEGFTGLWSDHPPVAFVPITGFAAAVFNGVPAGAPLEGYSWTWLEMIARRKPGVTPAAAEADLTLAYRSSYAAEAAESHGTNAIATARPHAVAGPVQVARGPQAGSDARVATLLAGVTAVLLLIACANVANLLLSRSFARRREIAVRLALGIGRARLVGQLLTEGMLLALAGGAVGLLVAQWGGALLHARLLADDESSTSVTDPRVLAFALGATLVAGLLTALVPALQFGRGELAASLKSGVREGARHRSRTRSALLLAQGALSVVLLVGAGLFVRSLQGVRAVSLGWDVEPLVWVSGFARTTALSHDTAGALVPRMLEEAQRLPEVQSATRAVSVPFMMTFEDRVFPDGADTAGVPSSFLMQGASPDYFRTMGVALLRGRAFTADDRRNTPKVAIVAARTARTLWPGGDAVGRCLHVGADTTPCTTVVGVAADTRTLELDGEPDLAVYLPAEQTLQGPGILVRVRGRGADHAESLRRALQPRMPGDYVVSARPMSAIYEPKVRSWRLGATMFSVFGALALLLAAIGLYSVIAYDVAQRRQELGVRVALGAQLADVVRLVLGQGLRLALAGIVLGSAIALVAAHRVAPLLYHVSPRDPLVFASVAVVLLVVSALATLIPARRAARVDPNSALRAD